MDDAKHPMLEDVDRHDENNDRIDEDKDKIEEEVSNHVVQVTWSLVAGAGLITAELVTEVLVSRELAAGELAARLVITLEGRGR